MRVLVIEDDEGIAAGLRAHLAQQGCAVDLCSTLAEGWAALQAEPFDLLLLDLGLPDGDGSVLLRRLRAAPAGRQPDAPGGRLPDPHLPVLVMTARDAVASRIAALDLGADDYVTKPFDAGELAARMRALRRRAAGRGTPTLQLGEVELDPSFRTARRAGVPVELSAREFDVLLALAEVRPRVLSRQQLEARLYEWDGGPDSNAVEVHVHRLRRKLGDGVIRTLRGVGYFVPAAD
jgi:DNA-binding response OmpR family regulator